MTQEASKRPSVADSVGWPPSVQLLTTREKTLPVPGPEFCWSLETLPLLDVLDLFSANDAAFAGLAGVHPERADTDALNELQRTVRGRHYRPPQRRVQMSGGPPPQLSHVPRTRGGTQ